MKWNSSILVNDLLRRENNNLDLFRIAAALLVIVGHSYILFPSVGEIDQIKNFTGFTYSGALAVKIFFFISGLVVTNSIIKSKSFIHFTVSRIFRIFPALIFICLLTAFVIGPFLTSLPLSNYFNTGQPLFYFKNNILLKTEYFIPDLFHANKYPNVVNGALWSLPEEVGCYLFLLAIFSIGILKNKWAASIVFGLLIIDLILPHRIFTYWKSDNPEIALLPACFAIGAILAINKDKLTTNFLQTIGLSLLTFILWGTRFTELVFCFTIFSLIINLSATEIVKRFKIKNDVSYGIYLWGFLVQQIVQHFIVDQTVYLKMVISVVIAVGIACISWFLIEKRFINYGRLLIVKLNGL
jgi:peptidoglycan/LPS O-acetylase OafA/YrhL